MTTKTITMPSGKVFTLRYMDGYPEWKKPSFRIEHRSKWLRERRKHREATQGAGWTNAEFVALCEKYDKKCLRCGRSEKLYPDHIVPLWGGGIHDLTNIQPLCFTCNGWKGIRVIDFRPCCP